MRFRSNGMHDALTGSAGVARTRIASKQPWNSGRITASDPPAMIASALPDLMYIDASATAFAPLAHALEGE